MFASFKNQLKKNLNVIIKALIVICILSSCFNSNNSSSSVHLTEIQFIDSKSGQKKASFNVALAIDEQTQAEGLMFRKVMAKNQGMLFIFSEEVQTSFWMKNTFLSLDMIFLNEQGYIVDIKTNTMPLSEQEITPSKPYRYCLELNAGIVQQYQLKLGDRMLIR